MLLLEAEQVLAGRDFLKVVSNCTAIIKQSPELATAHFILGSALMEVEQYEEAKTAFENVLSLNPDYPAIRFNLGHNAFLREQFPEALAFYNEEKSHIEPDDPLEKKRAIFMQIGRCHKRLGQIEEAVATFQLVVELDKNYHEVYNDLGEIYQQDGEYEKALKTRMRALELAPGTSEYAYYVGILLYKLERYEEAIVYLRQAAVDKPWIPGIYYNLGRSLVALGQIEEGQQYLVKVDSLQEKASQLNLAEYNAQVNDTARMWAIYADMLYRDQRYEEALRAFEKAHFLAPGDKGIGNAVVNLTKLVQKNER
jgi:tetratricopeptide (TPR) repeat protein